MTDKFKLIRTKQCAKCPWKVSTNPHDIPDGYCETKHENLKDTIANPSDLSSIFSKVQMSMACHHSNGKDEMYCVGWLVNQLGVGNNIELRMRMMKCSNIKDIKTYGNQHERFEDTLPKNKQ